MFKGSDYQLGFAASLVGHLLIFLLFIGLGGGISNFGAPIVYSVSIESGAKRGAISQAPKQTKRKSVPTPSIKQPKKTAAVKEKVTHAKEKAEVALPKKSVKVKATPVPVKVKPEKKKSTSKPKPPKKEVVAKSSSKKKQVVNKKKESSQKEKAPTLDEINSALERAVKKYTGESTDAGGKGYGSSGQGGNGFGGGESRPPEFFQYQELLEQYVKSGWAWHDPTAALKASVCFELSPEGGLISVRLCNPSGNRKYDESVVRAVQKADPVPPPPATVYKYFKEVRMTFSPQIY